MKLSEAIRPHNSEFRLNDFVRNEDDTHISLVSIELSVVSIFARVTFWTRPIQDAQRINQWICDQRIDRISAIRLNVNVITH